MFNRVKKAETAISHLMVNTNKEIEIIKKRIKWKLLKFPEYFQIYFNDQNKILTKLRVSRVGLNWETNQWTITQNEKQFSGSVVSNSLQPHRLPHTRLPCPLPTPRVYPNSCPLTRWCHPTISSSVIPFSSCLQSFPASGSFQMSQFFTGRQSIGVSASASVLPVNIQDWFPPGWTGWISLQSKGLSRVFSKVQKHQFFSAQLSHIHTWPLEKS